MLHSGRVAFGAMEAVVFGKPAAETLAQEARRLAEGAVSTPWVQRNPRPIAGPAQAQEILELAE